MLIALAMALAGQEIPDYRGLPIKQEELQVPIFGCLQEIAMGVKKMSIRTCGLSVNQLEAGHYGNQRPTNYLDARIGFTSWSVGSAVIGDKPGMSLMSNAYRNQTYEFRRNVYGLRHKGTRTWYVDESGRILAETCDLEMATGRWTLDVGYNAEDFTLTITTPKFPKRTMTVSPGCTMDELTATMFKPMLKPGPEDKEPEVILQEKTFYMLDPFSGSPVKCTAKVAGTFNGSVLGHKVAGKRIDLEGFPDKMTIWIAGDGTLVKAVLPSGAYLELENK